MRSLALFALVGTSVILTVSPAFAQGRPLCFRGQPAPACRSFILTETGANVLLAPQQDYRTEKVQIEFGLMRNHGPRSALGATIFAVTNLDDETYVGVKPRYRRWLSPTVGLDVSAGPRLDSQTGKFGGVAQVGVSFADWLSLTTQLDVGTPRYAGLSAVNWHIGVRLGSYPGVIGMVAVPIGLAIKGFGDSFTGWGY